VEKLIFLPYTTKESIRTIGTRNTIPTNNNELLRKPRRMSAKYN
jgi:hypothetical protein